MEYSRMYIFIVLAFLNKFQMNKALKSCVDIVSYYRSDNYWYALLLLDGTDPDELHIRTAALLSVKDKVPDISKYNGNITLYDSLAKTKEQLSQGQPIRYRIFFDPIYPVPKIYKVISNNRTICNGTADSDPRTLIQLSGNFYPQGESTAMSRLNNTASRMAPSTINQSPATNRNLQLFTDSEICGLVDIRYSRLPLVLFGEELRRGTWPWLVAVYIDQVSSLKFQCGGTLVSSRVVISSAHCFNSTSFTYTAEDVILFMGRHNLKNFNERGFFMSPSSKVIVHPDFRPILYNYDADIAVIIARDAVTFNEFIRPACLWSGPTNIDDIAGTQGRLVGWGLTENGDLNNVPRKASARIVTEDECLSSDDQFAQITSKRNFCAGDLNGVGPCRGDSGGGLLVQYLGRWMLRGTISSALSDNGTYVCDLHKYVIYTDIVKFLPWIRSVSLSIV